MSLTPFFHRWFLRRGKLYALLFSAVLSACASAPVQEMSDARQAIHAAEQAGAQTKAPYYFDRARESLESAEFALQRRNYGLAQEEAIRAKAAAIKAREQALESAAQGPSPQ